MFACDTVCLPVFFHCLLLTWQSLRFDLWPKKKKKKIERNKISLRYLQYHQDHLLIFNLTQTRTEEQEANSKNWICSLKQCHQCFDHWAWLSVCTVETFGKYATFYTVYTLIFLTTELKLQSVTVLPAAYTWLPWNYDYYNFSLC